MLELDLLLTVGVRGEGQGSGKLAGFSCASEEILVLISIEWGILMLGSEPSN